jgi:hypothetical protein
MKVLKNISVAILSFLLFLFLSVFGIAFMIKSTVLNADFVTRQVNNLDVTSLLRSSFQIETPSDTPELDEILFDTLGNIEPVLKERVGATIHAVYSYFPGKAKDIEMGKLLRENLLTDDLVAGIVDNADLPALVGTLLGQQLGQSLPVEVEGLDKYLEEAVRAAEPAVREQLLAVSGPVFDYILGESGTLDTSVSLVEVKQALFDTVRQSLADSPPPELQSVPAAERESLIDAFLQEVNDQVPSVLAIDENIIGPEVPVNFAEAMNSVEAAMVEADVYIGYFETGYLALMAVMALLVVGIILILRDVRAITRSLGVPLITYGAIEYAGVWVARYFMGGQFTLIQGIPPQLETWMYGLADDLMRPVEIFSLALLITGVVLTVVSYVYKRGREAD